MTDMRRENRFFQKKQECRFAIDLKEGTESYELALGSGNHQLANLPDNCIITDAYMHVKVVGDMATSGVATLGTASGGSQIMSAADMDAATGKTGTFTGQSDTGTGVTLWLGITITGGQTAVGQYVIVVEYLEYTKNTGDYTEIPNL